MSPEWLKWCKEHMTVEMYMEMQSSLDHDKSWRDTLIKWSGTVLKETADYLDDLARYNKLTPADQSRLTERAAALREEPCAIMSDGVDNWKDQLIMKLGAALNGTVDDLKGIVDDLFPDQQGRIQKRIEMLKQTVEGVTIHLKEGGQDASNT